MKDTRTRLDIAEEIIRRCDTISLLTVDEVRDIRRRALAGELDDIFAMEPR